MLFFCNFSFRFLQPRVQISLLTNFYRDWYSPWNLEENRRHLNWDKNIKFACFVFICHNKIENKIYWFLFKNGRKQQWKYMNKQKNAYCTKFFDNQSTLYSNPSFLGDFKIVGDRSVYFVWEKETPLFQNPQKFRAPDHSIISVPWLRELISFIRYFMYLDSVCINLISFLKSFARKAIRYKGKSCGRCLVSKFSIVDETVEL